MSPFHLSVSRQLCVYGLRLLFAISLLAFVESNSWAGDVLLYGMRIKVEHLLTQKRLHSHQFNYGHPRSSGQQQITAFPGYDDNDYWIIKRRNGDNNMTKTPVKNGDVIRLQHLLTGKNLHSHAGYPSPVTQQQEVTAFGNAGNDDDNDNWTVQVDGENVLKYDSRFRLIHTLTNHALHSHNGYSHRNWTQGQQEVTAYPSRDDNDWWQVISPAGHIELPEVEPQNDGWSCGPNSATRVLRFYGVMTDYDEMKSRIGNEDALVRSFKAGSPPHAVRDGMNKVLLRSSAQHGSPVVDGFSVQRDASFSTLLSKLKKGIPVIALLRVSTQEVPIAVMGKHTIVGGVLERINARPNVTANYPLLHWIVVNGYQEHGAKIAYMDTTGDQQVVPVSEFRSKWEWTLGDGVPKSLLDSKGVQGRTIIFRK